MTALSCLLCGLYIELGASVHQSHALPPLETRTLSDGYQVTFQPYRLYDLTQTKNPYGIATIGFRYLASPKWTIDIALWRHESSLATSEDKGTDSHAISVRWSPWGQP